MKTETLDYEDSTAHSRLEIKAELPKPGQGAAVDRIRAALIEENDGLTVDKFIDPSSLDAIQPLLRKGLTDYFADGEVEITSEELDDMLFLESASIIPFPAWTPFPTEDGLVFTYQQYEIAAYAAGMPNFIISYDDVLPYLTPEAKTLLGLGD
ncbi:MAG: DUF3298 domain-containing protein [Bacteroidales bacterium]|nr:DUF3298 domain-containing protein [Bacteroidales bacterium]